MSVGPWIEKHPWMTFFLAGSAISGVVAIARVIGGQPALGRFGVDTAVIDSVTALPPGWNDPSSSSYAPSENDPYTNPYAVNQSVPYRPDLLNAADQSVPYRPDLMAPKGPPAWALPVGLGLTALAAVAFVSQPKRRSQR